MSHYATLGISANASNSEIKAAFRKLAFKLHPDHNKNPGAVEQFKRVNAAYTALTNNTTASPAKKARQPDITVDITISNNRCGFTFARNGRHEVYNIVPGCVPGDTITFDDGSVMTIGQIKNENGIRRDAGTLHLRQTVDLKKSQNKKGGKFEYVQTTGFRVVHTLPKKIDPEKQIVTLRDEGLLYRREGRRSYGNMIIHFNYIDDTPEIIKKAKKTLKDFKTFLVGKWNGQPIIPIMKIHLFWFLTTWAGISAWVRMSQTF